MIPLSCKQNVIVKTWHNGELPFIGQLETNFLMNLFDHKYKLCAALGVGLRVLG